MIRMEIFLLLLIILIDRLMIFMVILIVMVLLHSNFMVFIFFIIIIMVPVFLGGRQNFLFRLGCGLDTWLLLLEIEIEMRDDW